MAQADAICPGIVREGEMTAWTEVELLFGGALVRAVQEHGREAKALEDHLRKHHGAVLQWDVWRGAPIDMVVQGKQIKDRLQRFEIRASLDLAGGHSLTSMTVVTAHLVRDGGADRDKMVRWVVGQITQELARALITGSEPPDET
jgi:hypothetical protein